MFAVQTQDTSQQAPSQYKVPAPRPEERKPAYIEDLAIQLERKGKGGLAAKVKQHAEGYFRLNFHWDGHTCAYPLSCGHSLEPWCRQRELMRWLGSLLKAANHEPLGYSFETICPLSDEAVELIKSVVRKKIYPNRGAAAFDFVSIDINKWRLVFIASGLSGDAAEEVVSGLQSLSLGLDMISVHSFPLCELGEELDRVMPRAGDFDGRSEMLLQYLGIKFGKKMMATRAPKCEIPLVDIGAGFLPELENAAEMFKARVNGGFEPAVELRLDEAAPDINSDIGEGPAPPQDPRCTLGAQVRDAQTATGERPPDSSALASEELGTDPPKTTPVSYRSEDAIDFGPPCRMCRMPIKSSGRYQLVGTTFRRDKGNGPDEVPARYVMEPSGELRARLGYG